MSDRKSDGVGTNVARRARKLAPGLVGRVQREGWVSAAAFSLDVRRLRATERRAAAFRGIAARRTAVESARIARALWANGERWAAATVLDEAIGRAPDSSTLYVERARVRLAAGNADGKSDVILAARGDLRAIDLVALVVLAARRLDHPQFDEVQAALRAGDLPREVDATLRVVEALRRAETDEVLELAIVAGYPAQRLLIEWCRTERNWTMLAGLAEACAASPSFAAAPDKLKEELCSAVRLSGRLTDASRFAEMWFAATGSERSKKYLALLREEVSLLERGVERPVRSPRGSGREGKVGYLLHNSLPYTSGGYATRSHGLLTGLVSRGWDVTALSRPRYPLDMAKERKKFLEAGSPPAEGIDGVAYRRVLDKASVPGVIGRVEFYKEAVKLVATEERWSVVHGASNYPQGLAAALAGAELGIPSIYEVRGLWELTRLSRDPEYGGSEHFRMVARLEADACKAADHAFAITGAVKKIMVERGVPEDHITILPNGVNTDRFVPLAPNMALKESLGLSGKTIIGYVGSVVDYEGLPLLAEAVASLKGQGLPVALLVVGDGDAYSELKDAVVDNGIEDITVLPGRVPHEDVESYYSIIDIAPFPRLPLPVTEAVSPLKPFEAMAMAKPIVVSSVNALEEIVSEGVNGRVFNKGSAESLAEVLGELVGVPEARASLGASARSWVVENRSWEKISTRIDDVYASLGVPGPSGR